MSFDCRRLSSKELVFFLLLLVGLAITLVFVASTFVAEVNFAEAHPLLASSTYRMSEFPGLSFIIISTRVCSGRYDNNLGMDMTSWKDGKWFVNQTFRTSLLEAVVPGKDSRTAIALTVRDEGDWETSLMPGLQFHYDTPCLLYTSDAADE